MKCYHTYDEKGKKHFIPMCYGSINLQCISGCNCPEPTTEYRFAKELFNKILEQKDDTIASLEAELTHLRKVIIKLNKNIK